MVRRSSKIHPDYALPPIGANGMAPTTPPPLPPQRLGSGSLAAVWQRRCSCAAAEPARLVRPARAARRAPGRRGSLDGRQPERRGAGHAAHAAGVAAAAAAGSPRDGAAGDARVAAEEAARVVEASAGGVIAGGPRRRRRQAAWTSSSRRRRAAPRTSSKARLSSFARRRRVVSGARPALRLWVGTWNMHGKARVARAVAAAAERL